MTCETETTALAAKIHAECEFCFDRNDIHEALELLGQMVDIRRHHRRRDRGIPPPARQRYEADLASD